MLVWHISEAGYIPAPGFQEAGRRDLERAAGADGSEEPTNEDFGEEQQYKILPWTSGRNQCCCAYFCPPHLMYILLCSFLT
jgi:hypothetical protein